MARIALFRGVPTLRPRLFDLQRRSSGGLMRPLELR